MTRRPVDPALRQAVEAALVAGTESVTAIAARFGIQRQTASVWRQALVAQGRCPPLRHARAPQPPLPPTTGTQVAWLRCQACGHPFPYRFQGDPATKLHTRTLSLVDRLCMPCFDAYCTAAATLQGVFPSDRDAKAEECP